MKKFLKILPHVGAALFLIAALVFVFKGLEFYRYGSKALNAAETSKSNDGPERSQLSRLGDFGSYVQGPVASYWALAATCLIFATLALQMHQLDEQSAQFKEQHESTKRQNFESSFFELLTFQNELARQISVKVRRGWDPKLVHYEEMIGRNCFKEFCDQLRHIYQSPKERENFLLALVPTQGVLKTPPERELVLSAYASIYKEHQNALSHYFRNLYHVIKFVDESKIEDKRRYTSLARAQLSAPELALLFYNGMSEYGEKFKPLIEKFGLFEHLDKTLLLNPSHRQEKWYDEKAFH